MEIGNMEKDLRAIIQDPSRVQTGEAIDKACLTDIFERLHGTAAALVRPLSTEEVSRVLRYAHEHRLPVTTRGAGTNLVGSAVPRGNGILLDLSLMNRILEIDEDTFTATVEPGILLKDFQEVVESRGLFYPPDPGEKEASIGGNIATNAGGMRAVKYGVTRDYVRGLEIVLANGDVLTVGSKNVKDASGLSLKNLVIGSEGTLAVITKCILRLLPKPQASLSALVPYDSLETGISSVHAILMANLNPTSVEFIERDVVALGESYTGVRFPCPDAKAYILLTLDGDEETVRRSAEKAREVVRKTGALDFVPLEDPAFSADIWKVRGCLVKAVEAVSEEEPLDLVVPINKTAEFVRFVHEVERETSMRMVSFGHAGDGNVHICIVRGDRGEAEWETQLHGAMSVLYRKAHELGGLTSGEHGVGTAKQPYFFENTPPENLALMRALKDAFDPEHILNDHISYLK